MAGTLKQGGASAPNTRTVWNFYVPAGQKITLLTQKDPTKSAEIAKSEGNGAGSVAPYAIFTGYGKASWKSEIAQHEWHQIVAKAKAAGLTIQELLFDQVHTTTVNGIPKMTVKLLGCSIGKVEDKTSADGNMVSLEGPALNIDTDGVLAFKEAEA